MPRLSTLGYGAFTEKKHQDFLAIFSLHYQIARRVMSRHRWISRTYQFFDITAGPGEYEGITGSPKMVIEHMENIGGDYEARFIEMNHGFHDSLRVTLSQFPHAKTVCLDNRVALPQMTRSICRPSCGLIYFDPTPTVQQMGAKEVLRDVFSFKSMARIDCLLYLSASTIKRVEHLTGENLNDWLLGIGKKHWTIRQPMGRHQWTFLLGSNWQGIPDWRTLGFYRYDSEEGRDIFDRLCFSKKREQLLSSKKQLCLFGEGLR